MKKLLLSCCLATVALSSFAAQVTTQTEPTNTQTQQTMPQQQPVVTPQVQPTPTTPPKKVHHKHHKPAFNHKEIWCGDKHITDQNADSLSDICEDFGYKHGIVKLRDDRSGDVISCKISGNQINSASCKPVK